MQSDTDLAALINEDDDTPFSLTCDPLRERRGRPTVNVDPASRRFNEALWRIVKGKYDIGGICHELAVITGLSPETIRGRIDSVEYDPEPLPAGTGLTSDEMKYLGKICKNSDDHEVRDWFRGISGGRRKDPDRDDRRVARERITTKDGTKLISVAIGPSRN